MINTRNTTLYQRPKAFNTIGVDITLDIDFRMVVNPFMFITKHSHSIIGGELVSIECSVLRDLISHKRNKCMPLSPSSLLFTSGTTWATTLPFLWVALFCSITLQARLWETISASQTLITALRLLDGLRSFPGRLPLR